jgi:hypothetical protein
MEAQRIFISYRHDHPWTDLAKALRLKLQAAMGAGDEVFLDTAIRAGDAWKQEVDGALAACTHFVALLCDDYWVMSNECLRELYAAVARHEAGGRPRLLFVLAADMLPARLTLDAARAKGSLPSPAGAPQLKALGDINFLGPFDANGRLEPLAKGRRLDKQLGQLRDRLLASGGFGAG